MSTEAAPTTWEAFARQLGLEVQRRRAELGASQEDLAHRAGLTRTHYQRIEKGAWNKGDVSNPSIKVLARLAQALDIEVVELLPSVAQIAWDDPA